MRVSSHPPITEVAVFSVRPMDTIAIGIRPIGSSYVTWHELSLIHVGMLREWNEYRIAGWMQCFPSCLLENLCCDSKRGRTVEEYASTTFFDNQDCYGYYRDLNRIGYSVKEGSSFFVNYLGPPSQWKPSNHCSQWPPQFQREVWNLLLCCKRLGGAWKDLKLLLIRQLAQLWLGF